MNKFGLAAAGAAALLFVAMGLIVEYLYIGAFLGLGSYMLWTAVMVLAKKADQADSVAVPGAVGATVGCLVNAVGPSALPWVVWVGFAGFFACAALLLAKWVKKRAETPPPL